MQDDGDFDDSDIESDDQHNYSTAVQYVQDDNQVHEFYATTIPADEAPHINTDTSEIQHQTQNLASL